MTQMFENNKFQEITIKKKINNKSLQFLETDEFSTL